jgi:type VI secretion system protein ImpA
MSLGLDSQLLLGPLPGDQPCGESLEASQFFGALTVQKVFGRKKPPEAVPEQVDREREPEKITPPPDWDLIRATAAEALKKGKDLRVLTHLSAAVLRTGDPPDLSAFAEVLSTAASWLDTYWDHVHPVVDEDAMERRNALNCFADPMAVVDRVWRLPVVASKQHGRFGLRDIDLATGQVRVSETETRPDEAAIKAAFEEMPLDRLMALDKVAVDATAALNGIDATMRGKGGPEVAPDFGLLLNQFAKLRWVCRQHLEARSPVGDGAQDAAQTGHTAAGGATGGVITVGAIGSRQDAIRALDAVAEFFRRNEPSSPVPLFVERAKRLVSKNFLEVLADIAPDSLAVARSAGGLKPEE